MTGFDLRARLAELADDIEPGPARSVHLIEAEARRMRRRRRTGWALGTAVVSVAATVTIPTLVGEGKPDRPPSTPAPTINPQPLPEGAGPCSPTAGTDAGRELVLVIDDCRITLLDVGDKITYPALSPEGKAIAFVTYERGDAELKVRNLENGDTRTLASSVDTIGDPVWSPDGATLAFWLNDGGGHPYIYTVSVDGGDADRVTTEDLNSFAPAWSPDGSELAYAQQDGIWTVNPATGDARRVAEGTPLLGDPFWGTNNQMALYAIQSGAGEPAEKFRVVELDPETGDVTGTSDWIHGMSTEGVYDDFGIHVAALTTPYPTSIVTTLDYDLSVVSEQAVKGAQIFHLPARVAR